MMKYVFAAKIWFMKTSTKILKYQSRIVKSEPCLPVSFERHINEKVNKENSLESISRQRSLSITIYINFITARRIWSYCLKSTTKNLINIIENVQHRASKLEAGMSGTICREKWKVLDLPTLQ